MELARIIGTVVATQKSDHLQGIKFLLAEPLDHEYNVTGEPFIVADDPENFIGASNGDVIYWIGGSEAALALKNPFVPVDAAIVGLVDKVDVE